MKELTLVTALVALFGLAAAAQPGDAPAYKIEGDVVVKVNSDNTESVIYESSQAIRLGSLSLSPNGEYIAFLETQPGVVEGGVYKSPPRNRMVICSAEGTVVRFGFYKHYASRG